MNEQDKYTAAFWSTTPFFEGWNCTKNSGQWFFHEKQFPSFEEAKKCPFPKGNVYYQIIVEPSNPTESVFELTKKNQPYYRQFEKKGTK